MANIVFKPNHQNYSMTNFGKRAGEQTQSLPKSRLSPQLSLYKGNRQDVYTRVTNRIIADLEKGSLTWIRPWSADCAGCVSLPLRSDGTPYRGINVLILWAASIEMGYKNPMWLTYRKAQELGGQIKKGVKGTQIVYVDTFSKSEVDDKGEETTSEIPFLKGYTVFNVEQFKGLPDKFYVVPADKVDFIDIIEPVDRFICSTGADIRHGGSRAFYSSTHDFIQMPPSPVFRDYESYFSTLVHELTHWTSHPSRLNRTFEQKRFGDQGYAMEELTAEIGSAFLCAELGITPEIREDHAAYIQSWLTVLKNDSRAIFKAASYAQRAVDYLYSLNVMHQ